MSDSTFETPLEKWVTSQRPPLSALDVVGESPLYHADLAGVAAKGPQAGGVYFCEQALLGLLTLRCAPSLIQQNEIAAILGVALPMTSLVSIDNDDSMFGELSVRWISPDEWLISVPGGSAFELETHFFESLSGHFALVNVSGGMTVFDVSGDHVVDMLKKSVPVDLHISAFPVGKVVSTLFAKSGVVMRRLGETHFELIVRRSFADYCWLWIQDASREFGLVVNFDLQE